MTSVYLPVVSTAWLYFRICKCKFCRIQCDIQNYLNEYFLLNIVCLTFVIFNMHTQNVQTYYTRVHQIFFYSCTLIISLNVNWFEDSHSFHSFSIFARQKLASENLHCNTFIIFFKPLRTFYLFIRSISCFK